MSLFLLSNVVLFILLNIFNLATKYLSCRTGFTGFNYFPYFVILVVNFFIIRNKCHIFAAIVKIFNISIHLR